MATRAQHKAKGEEDSSALRYAISRLSSVARLVGATDTKLKELIPSAIDGLRLIHRLYGPESLAAISQVQDALTLYAGASKAASTSVAGLALCASGATLPRRSLWDLEHGLHDLMLEIFALLWVHTEQSKPATSDPAMTKVRDDEDDEDDTKIKDQDPTSVKPPTSVPLIHRLRDRKTSYASKQLPSLASPELWERGDAIPLNLRIVSACNQMRALAAVFAARAFTEQTERTMTVSSPHPINQLLEVKTEETKTFTYSITSSTTSQQASAPTNTSSNHKLPVPAELALQYLMLIADSKFITYLLTNDATAKIRSKLLEYVAILVSPLERSRRIQWSTDGYMTQVCSRYCCGIPTIKGPSRSIDTTTAAALYLYNPTPRTITSHTTHSSTTETNQKNSSDLTGDDTSPSLANTTTEQSTDSSSMEPSPSPSSSLSSHSRPGDGVLLPHQYVTNISQSELLNAIDAANACAQTAMGSITTTTSLVNTSSKSNTDDNNTSARSNTTAIVNTSSSSNGADLLGDFPISSSYCLTHHLDYTQKLKAAPNVMHFLDGEARYYEPFKSFIAQIPIAQRAYTIFRKIRKYQRMTSPKTSSNSSSTASPTTPTTRTAQLAYAIHLFKTHIASPTNTIPQEAIALPDATIRSISSTLLSCTPSLFADLERVCIQILEYVFKRGFVSSGAYHMYERAVSLPDNVKQLLLETREMRLSQVESAAKATPQVRLDEVDRERWHKWMADIIERQEKRLEEKERRKKLKEQQRQQAMQNQQSLNGVNSSIPTVTTPAIAKETSSLTPQSPPSQGNVSEVYTGSWLTADLAKSQGRTEEETLSTRERRGDTEIGQGENLRDGTIKKKKTKKVLVRKKSKTEKLKEEREELEKSAPVFRFDDGHMEISIHAKEVAEDSDDLLDALGLERVNQDPEYEEIEVTDNDDDNGDAPQCGTGITSDNPDASPTGAVGTKEGHSKEPPTNEIREQDEKTDSKEELMRQGNHSNDERDDDDGDESDASTSSVVNPFLEDEETQRGGRKKPRREGEGEGEGEGGEGEDDETGDSDDEIERLRQVYRELSTVEPLHVDTSDKTHALD